MYLDEVGGQPAQLGRGAERAAVAGGGPVGALGAGRRQPSGLGQSPRAVVADLLLFEIGQGLLPFDAAGAGVEAHEANLAGEFSQSIDLVADRQWEKFHHDVG